MLSYFIGRQVINHAWFFADRIGAFAAVLRPSAFHQLSSVCRL